MLPLPLPLPSSPSRSLLLLPSLLFVSIVFIPTCFSKDDDHYTACAPQNISCGSRSFEIRFPFRAPDLEGKRPHYCTYPTYNLSCNQGILVGNFLASSFTVERIDYKNHILRIVDSSYRSSAGNCPRPNRNSTVQPFFVNYSSSSMSGSFGAFPFNYTHGVQNLTLYLNCTAPSDSEDLHRIGCLDVKREDGSVLSAHFALRQPVESDWVGRCSPPLIIPVMREEANRLWRNGEVSFGAALGSGFDVEWVAGWDLCRRCEMTEGRCGFDPEKMTEFKCFCRGGMEDSSCPAPTSSRNKRMIILKTVIGVAAAVVGCLITSLAAYLWYRKKHLAASSKLISRSASSDPSSKSELGHSKSYLPTHIFDYKELEEATNNFDPTKEVGEGGFGTVYHGKLYDGRSVAVKRLYENNFRRVEQFMNEIKILSGLRHRNLVSLYGCTSRHSRELLLVYEFVPNGTVADHLHGKQAKPGNLTWSVRLGIAIETADALSYLHKVEIIHRDVKTNNILLDNNFQVKVADFGLSRLFPMDKTHISTVPQGTPGYLDPDYHRCYQLTDKSDVYSFGVVLFELISSKSPVDISRHRHDINLSNMAINKINNNALHELVDPSLGFSDIDIRSSITSVAELGYQCLHDEKDMRPSMEEVVMTLREIESATFKANNGEGPDDPADDDVVVLLKKMEPPSPDTVTSSWISQDTTPNASG